MVKSALKKVNDFTYFIASSPNIQLFSHMLFSHACIVCEAESKVLVCVRCEKLVTALRVDKEKSCPVCAMPVQVNRVCGQCLSNKPSFDRTVSAFFYKPPIAHVISKYKYNAKLWTVKWLSEELLKVASDERRPDIIFPVPLSAFRIKERGYNQSWEIAKRLAKSLNCFAVPDGLIRIRDFQPQQQLSRRKRLLNPKGGFACHWDVVGKQVAVVDDVMTTGATVSEIANVLKKAGAAGVVVWVVARTP